MAQLLHVYMVKNRRPPLGPSPLASPSSPLPPQIGSPSPADAERTRIDPAVVRAVDRNRQSLERQQQQDKLVASGMMRARTYSEGALYRLVLNSYAVYKLAASGMMRARI